MCVYMYVCHEGTFYTVFSMHTHIRVKVVLLLFNKLQIFTVSAANLLTAINNYMHICIAPSK
jgi:hypothetical protein